VLGASDGEVLDLEGAGVDLDIQRRHQGFDPFAGEDRVVHRSQRRQEGDDLGQLGVEVVRHDAAFAAAASLNRSVRCTGSLSNLGMTYLPRSSMVRRLSSSVGGPKPNTSWSAPAASHAIAPLRASSGVPFTDPGAPIIWRAPSSVTSGMRSGHLGISGGCGNVSW